MKSFSIFTKFLAGVFIAGLLSVSGWGADTDLSITKSVDNASPTVGQNVTFTLVGKNNGATTTDITITDTLPAGLTWVSDTDNKSSFDCTNSGNAVTCTGTQNFSTNETVTITIVAKVTSPGAITNTASIVPTTSGVTDAITTSNNSASVILTASAPDADLSITKSVDNASPTVGQNVTFTLVGKNNGPTITDITITDTLPAGLTWVSDTDNGKSNFDCTNSGNAVTCTGSEDFSTNETVTITIVAKVTSPGAITNTASIVPTTSGVTDAITTSNNSASVSLTATAASVIEATSQDICYNPVQTQGFSIFGMGMFYGVTTPLENVSGETLSGVTIVKSFDGINMSMMSTIKLDGVTKTTAQDSDEGEIDQALSTTFGSFNMGGMFDKGIVYYPNSDGTFNTGQTHEIYDYSMFSFNWANVSINALYTKNGITYKAKVNACPLAPTTGDNLRPFSMAYTSNEKGNIKIIGNSVLLADDTCTDKANNDVTNPTYAKKDPTSDDSSYLNSTMSKLILPAGVSSSDIRYAALTWQGRLAPTTINSSGIADKAQKVRLKLPGISGGYQEVTSNISKFNWSYNTNGGGNGDDYQGIADITTLLQQSVANHGNTAGYDGDIWVADVLADLKPVTGDAGYGAWSIIVVYHDNTTTLKNLTVYDGYLKINDSISESVPLSGFITPTADNFNASFFIFGGEGDVGYGDRVSLTNKAGTAKLLSTTGEVFNSTVTDESGANVTTRDPSCPNTIGIDIHSFNIGKGSSLNIIENGQTSTIVTLEKAKSSYTNPTANFSGYDTHFPGMFAFATDLYQPNMCYQEDIFNSSGVNISGIGAKVSTDEMLKIRVTIKNDGKEVAKGVQVLQQFDNEKLPYVTGSGAYENFNASYVHTITTPATDATDTDFYEHNGVSFVTKLNLGDGASSIGGGIFTPISTQPQAYAVYEYNTTVKSLDQNFSNDYYAAYVSDFGLDYSGNPTLMEPCTGSKNSFWEEKVVSNPGSIDAVSNYTQNGYTANSGLMTRVASQANTTIDTVWLGTGATPTNYPYSDPMPVMITLSDATCSTDENISSTGGYATATFTSDGNPLATTGSFTLTSKTMSNAKLRLKYIDWNNLPGGQDPTNCINSSSTLGALSGVPACLNDDKKIKEAFGEAIYNSCATGGVKPPCQSTSYANGLPSAPYDNEYGCFMCLANALNGPTCSSDTFAIRPANYTTTTTPSGTLKAGETFTLDTTARGISNTAITGYNGTATITQATQIASCPVRDGNLTNSANTQFSNIVFNGIDTNSSVNIKYGDIGEFDMNITDSTWTAVDAIKNECIPDSNITTPDANGLIGCNIHTTLNPKVTPDHFDFTTTLNNHNITNGFNYLSSNLNMSADLNSTVTAKAIGGTTTKNYTNSCYAKDINTSFTYTRSAIPQSLTNIIFQETNSSSAITTAAIGTSFSLNNIPKTVFHSDINGSAKLRYKINFDKNVSTAIDPFRMFLTSMTAMDTDGLTGTGNYSDKNATFLYARTHAPRYRFTGNSGPAKIYYETYCGTDGNKTMLPTGSIASSDSVGWYLNPSHNASTDGNITAIAEKNALHVSDLAPSNISGGISTTLTYDAANGYPYKTTIEVTPSTWLLYDQYNSSATKNDFEVEFYESSNNWTGTRPKDSDGNEIDQTTTDSTVAPVTNKRILW